MTNGVEESGPLPAVTLKDAISDLPPFEWQNPDHPRNPERKGFNPQEFAPRQPIGFPNPVPYASPPTSSLQRSSRISIAKGTVLDAVRSHQIRGHEYTDLGVLFLLSYQFPHLFANNNLFSQLEGIV